MNMLRIQCSVRSSVSIFSSAAFQARFVHKLIADKDKITAGSERYASVEAARLRRERRGALKKKTFSDTATTSTTTTTDPPPDTPLTPSLWEHDIPLSSPAGKMFYEELGKILRRNVYKQAVAEVANGGAVTYFAPLVLCLNAFPKLAYAYQRAGVAAPSANLTVLAFIFPSLPTTMYCVATAKRRGAFWQLQNYHRNGLKLTRGQIVCGPTSGVHHDTDVSGVLQTQGEAPELTRYFYVNSFGIIGSPGPRFDEVSAFNSEEFLRYEKDTNLGAPPATLKGDVFVWGGTTDSYVRPVRDGEDNTTGPSVGDYGANIFNPMNMMKEQHILESSGHQAGLDVDAALAGRASLLYDSDPEKARAFYEAERKEGMQRLERFRAKAKENIKSKRFTQVQSDIAAATSGVDSI